MELVSEVEQRSGSEMGRYESFYAKKMPTKLIIYIISSQQRQYKVSERPTDARRPPVVLIT